MKSVFKKMGLFLMSAIMMAVIFTGCSGGGMNGTYLSDTEDKYKIVIDGDNVKWYEGSMVFDGTVKADGDDLTFEIKGSGIFSDHVFYAEKTDDGFKMKEDSIKGENFTKE